MSAPAHAEVRPYGGVPWLWINGEPFLGWAHIRAIERYAGFEQYDFDDVLADYRLQAANGARLFSFNSTCASDFYERCWGDVWLDRATFDFSHLDRFMTCFRDECGRPWAMPKLNLFLPRWWEEQHPDELQRFWDGRIHAPYGGESTAMRDVVVSLASEQWYADMTMCLERYLDYAESRYGDQIIGYWLCAGITHEWGILGSFDFVDYSAPMQRYWRRWVLQRYRDQPPYDPERIPTRDERLREPRVLAAIDFQLCLSDLVAQRIMGFCDTVKRKTAQRKVTAVYYGYTLTCREGGLKFLGRYGCGGFQGGHLAMRKVLASAAVDVITSPFSYGNRRLGTGDLQPHYAEQSVIRAGKVSWLQDDNRPWTGAPAKAIDTGHYPDAESFLKQFRRAFARRMCGDDMFYQMDLLGGTYNDARIGAELRRLQELFEANARLRAPSLAELLVVVDEEAIAHLPLSSELMMQNVYRQSVEWARAGVPYHVVLVDDAAAMDLQPYRLILLCNSIVATPTVERLRHRAGEGLLDLTRLPAEKPLSFDAIGRYCEQAGCHRYARSGERIWRSPRLLGVHVDQAGEYRLALPMGHVIQRAILPPLDWNAPGGELRLRLEAGETAVFEVGN